MIKWYDSIVIKVLGFFLFFSTLLLISMIGTFSVVSKEDLKENAYTKAVLTGEKIVATLQKAQVRVEELAAVLADVGEKLAHDDAKNRELVRNLLNTRGHTNIVGGGIWPEPYALNPAKERLSYFYSRDEHGQLHYNDSYNDPEGDGYHHREWYVPARFFKPGETYWSKVYIDPHTHEAMITASAPMVKNGTFAGVATIDVKLEGIDRLLAEEVKPLEGYAFLVDREGKFIAYPGQLGIKIADIDKQTIFSVKSPGFLPLVEAIQQTTKEDISSDNYDHSHAEFLAGQIDRIDKDEAKSIAAIIQKHLKTAKTKHKRFIVDNDPLLNEDAFVTIFTIPDNHWKLVVALPASKAFAQSIQIYKNMILITVLVTLVTSIIGYLLIRKIAVVPIKKVSQQLQDIIKQDERTGKLLETDDKGELGILVYWFNRRTKALQKKYLEIEALNKEIEDTQKEVVFTMGAIGESRSKETGNHVKRVAEYSKLLALYYGMDEEEAEMLKQASPMHDIGKVAIPDAILNKPARFSEAERKVMDTHATLGYEILKYSNRSLMKTASIVAYEHHEKYNGLGYPQGLKGEEIHIYGRITALADVFDALGSARVYKPAWDDEKIFQLFKEERGEHFDPKLIDIFFEHLDEFLAIRDSMKDITG